MADAQQPNPSEMKPLDEALAEAKKLGWRVGIPALVAALLPAINGFLLIGFSIAYQDEWKAWIESHGLAGVLVFGAVFAVTTGLALMPTYAMSFAAGVFLGVKTGSIVVMPAIVVGALIGYVAAALLTRERFMRVIEQNAKARVIREAIIERSFWRCTVIVTLLRVPPNSPFAITNLVMSGVRVNPVSFIMGTAVGMAPRSLAVVWLGAGAGTLASMSIAGGWWTKAGAGIVTIVILLAAFKLLANWAKAALQNELDAHATR